MSVKIVSDSACDIPKELADELGIHVVPLYVNFGEESLKDGIDIKADDFYERLISGPIHPFTSQPSPGDFLDIYKKLDDDNDGIISIHLSSKLSGTFKSASIASEDQSLKSKIRVIDTGHVSMSSGLCVLEAARLAKSGSDMDTIIQATNDFANRAHFVGLLDTLVYLEKGGRIGKARSMLGSLLNIKPMITVENGESKEFGKARTFKKGIAKLTDFCNQFEQIQSLSVVYSTDSDLAKEFSDSLSSLLGSKPIISRIGPVTGTHSGPGTIGVGLISKI